MSAHLLLTAHRARFAPLLALPLALLTLSACQQRATTPAAEAARAARGGLRVTRGGRRPGAAGRDPA